MPRPERVITVFIGLGRLKRLLYWTRLDEKYRLFSTDTFRLGMMTVWADRVILIFCFRVGFFYLLPANCTGSVLDYSFADRTLYQIIVHIFITLFSNFFVSLRCALVAVQREGHCERSVAIQTPSVIARRCTHCRGNLKYLY